MSRFECPRCGSGVRPTDQQCGRCGEILQEKHQIDLNGESPRITLENMLSQTEIPVRLGDSDYVSVSRLRSMLERREQELARRENEMKWREDELLSSLEEIETDTRTMERTMERLEQEEVMLSEKERALKQREKELERISDRLAEWQRVMERYREVMHGEEFSPEDIEKIIQIQNDFQEALAKERDRLKEELKEELSDDLEAITLKEEQFRVTESILMKKALELRNMLRDRKQADGQKISSEEEGPTLDELMKETFKELNSQIGAGLQVSVNNGVVPTFIEPLDRVLQGGIPKKHVILVHGTSGTMKSTLSYYILHHCAAERGIRSMYFSLEQKRESIIRQMERLGLPRSESRENLIIVDMVDLRKTMVKEDGDWREILKRYVQNVKNAKNFDCFVLDSLESFKAMSGFVFSREDLAELFDWFREMGLTTLLISELPQDELLDSRQGELYLADGSIELIMQEIGKSIQRWIRVSKMRGVNIDQRYYSFKFENGSFLLTHPLTTAFR